MLMNMELPALLVGLFCAGGLAASMSSGDAMAHASASIAVRDGMVRALGMQLDSNRQRTLIRIAVVVLLLVSYVVSIVYRGDLVYLLLAAYGPVVQFAPPVVATLYWRRASGAGVLAGLISGGCVNLLFFLWPDLRPFEWHAGLYGLAVNVLMLVAVSWLTTRSLAEPESQFLATARGK
jgi:SSS family solute:Na+ symporter